ncbi:MAG: indolepyruvate oxidoreductase subunit beta [Spartobacteria bacterium]|nr:indolepyruvate oxidoreductase subunit beta [Spartobacteria bacterium]
MKFDLIIAGVGGQGILSIAAVLGQAAVTKGLFVKQAEVHGMAQRGGAVQSHFRLSNSPILSDVIPRGGADAILSMEPMEGLRYISWLSPKGCFISNSVEFNNINDYPPVEDIIKEINQLPRPFVFDGTAIAKQEGSARSLNMAMLGAVSPFISLLPSDGIETAIARQFERKGQDVVDANIRVYAAARALTAEAAANGK